MYYMNIGRDKVDPIFENTRNWALYPSKSVVSKYKKAPERFIALNDEMLREDVADVIYQTLKDVIEIDYSIELKYVDLNEVTKMDAIEFCTRAGILEGDNKGRVKPQANVTRAEFMTILERVDKILENY